jgi:peptide/nickel transport system substrate-binding protein
MQKNLGISRIIVAIIIIVIIIIAGAGAYIGLSGTTPTSSTTTPTSQTTTITSQTTAVTTSTTTSSSASPKSGGTLNVGLVLAPPTLNPLITTANQVHFITGQIFDPLLQYNVQQQPQPWIAQSWTISSNGTVYTFNLVKNATFSDGSPLTSQDVAFSLNASKNYNPLGEVCFKSISQIETPDNYTVVVKMTTPYAPFLGCLGGWILNILPAHIYDNGSLLTNSHNLSPVGSGPFILKNYVQNQYVDLVKNPHYWVKDKPYLDEVIFHIYSNAQSMVLALQQGTIQFIPENVPYSSYTTLKADSSIVMSSVPETTMPNTEMLYFNLRNSILSNVQVRHAIAYALNTTLINQLATNGSGIPTNSPIPNSSPWYYSGVSTYPFNTTKASQLLDQAGYPKQSNGTRFSLGLIYIASLGERVAMANVIKSELAQVGINVNLQAVDFATQTNLIYTQWKFDMFIGGIGDGPDPSIGVARYLVASEIGHTPFTNAEGYNNSQVSQLFAQVATTTNSSQRLADFQQIQKIVTADLPTYWIFIDSYPTAWTTNVHGMPLGPWSDSEPMTDVWLS